MIIRTKRIVYHSLSGLFDIKVIYNNSGKGRLYAETNGDSKRTYLISFNCDAKSMYFRIRWIIIASAFFKKYLHE